MSNINLTSTVIDAAGGDPTARALAKGGRGNVVAFLGNSLTEHGIYPNLDQNDATKLRYDAWGYSAWARAHSLGRWYTDWSLNYGVSGDTLEYRSASQPGIASRIIGPYSPAPATAGVPARPGLLARRPDIVVIEAGTNSDAAQTPHAISGAELVRAVQLLTGAGIAVILTTDLPRSGWGSLTSGQILFGRQQASQRRRLIFQLARDYPCVTVCDWAPRFQSATGAGIADLLKFVDGLHPGNLGAFYMGQIVNQAILEVLGSRSIFDCGGDPSGDYHVTDNPTGNMLLNSNFQGSAGSVSGSATANWPSPVKPTSWILGNSNGNPAGVSIRGASSHLSSRPDGNPGTQWQAALTMSAADAQNGFYGEALSIYQFVSNLVAARTYRLRSIVSISNTLKMVGLRAQVRFQTGGAATRFTTADLDPAANSQNAGITFVPGIPDGWSGDLYLETPPYTLPAGTDITQGQCGFDFYLDHTSTSSTATVQPRYAYFGTG